MAAVQEARFPRSEAVRSIRYFTPRRELEVNFTNERAYLYFKVPQEKFDEFRSAESAGGYFNEHIRNRYPYTELR